VPPFPPPRLPPFSPARLPPRLSPRFWARPTSSPPAAVSLLLVELPSLELLHGPALSADGSGSALSPLVHPMGPTLASLAGVPLGFWILTRLVRALSASGRQSSAGASDGAIALGGRMDDPICADDVAFAESSVVFLLCHIDMHASFCTSCFERALLFAHLVLNAHRALLNAHRALLNAHRALLNASSDACDSFSSSCGITFSSSSEAVVLPLPAADTATMTTVTLANCTTTYFY